MSNDNSFAKQLYSEELNLFMSQLKNTAEDIDFYWNMLQFHMNVVFQKQGIIGVYNFYKSLYAPQLNSLLQSAEGKSPA
jgi:hypothetical protein